MARTNLTVSPARIERQLSRSDGISSVDFPGLGAPRRLHDTGFTGHLVCAFTPTGASVTLAFDGTDALAITGGTARVTSVVGQGLDAALPFHVRLWARRKPGTTGAIIAQTITLKGGASAANTLGKIFVEAAAAGAHPVCDFLDIPRYAAGDSQHTWDSTDTVVITCTGADTDLEIVYEAYGSDTA